MAFKDSSEDSGIMDRIDPPRLEDTSLVQFLRANPIEAQRLADTMRRLTDALRMHPETAHRMEQMLRSWDLAQKSAGKEISRAQDQIRAAVGRLTHARNENLAELGCDDDT